MLSFKQFLVEQAVKDKRHLSVSDLNSINEFIAKSDAYKQLMAATTRYGFKFVSLNHKEIKRGFITDNFLPKVTRGLDSWEMIVRIAAQGRENDLVVEILPRDHSQSDIFLMPVKKALEYKISMLSNENTEEKTAFEQKLEKLEQYYDELEKVCDDLAKLSVSLKQFILDLGYQL